MASKIYRAKTEQDGGGSGKYGIHSGEAVGLYRGERIEQ